MRQQLNVISIISNGFTATKQVGNKIIFEDIQNARKIIKTTQKLSKLLENIGEINFKNISMKEIEKIISISNKMIHKG